MPCSDGGPVYHDDPETKQRLDKVTRLLCGLCQSLKNQGLDDDIYTTPELGDWWDNHQEQDRVRLECERKEKEEKEAKLKALAKLSPRERRLLGLK
jgi:hypothetical protein